jgi:Arc/MetJ family transcription regulator
VKNAAIPANSSHGARSADFCGTFLRIKWCHYSCIHREDQMRTTVTLDDDLLAKAIKLTGGLDRSTVLREGLKALIERESALRLAKLGATQPQLEPVPRRRSSAAT